MNLTGILRDRWGTLRSAAALTNFHLIRVRLRGKEPFRSYAKPMFRQYVQSLHPRIPVLPFVEAMKVVGVGHMSLRITIPDLEGYVGLSDWDRITLANIVSHHSMHPCFEIGTAAGSTALLLSFNTSEVVYTLDLPSDDPDAPIVLTRLKTDDEVIVKRQRASLLRVHPRENVVELVGDSATFDYEPYYGRIGVFFIDGAHSSEYVSSDTRNASLCCRDDGVIVWDDFGGSRDVTDFLDTLTRRGVSVYGIEGTKLVFSKDLNRIRQATKQ